MATYLDVYAIIGTSIKGRKYWVGKCDGKPDNLWIDVATGICTEDVMQIIEARYSGKKCWVIFLDPVVAKMRETLAKAGD